MIEQNGGQVVAQTHQFHVALYRNVRLHVEKCYAQQETCMGQLLEFSGLEFLVTLHTCIMLVTNRHDSF